MTSSTGHPWAKWLKIYYNVGNNTKDKRLQFHTSAFANGEVMAKFWDFWDTWFNP